MEGIVGIFAAVCQEKRRSAAMMDENKLTGFLC
jgi:hypothetical protein